VTFRLQPTTAPTDCEDFEDLVVIPIVAFALARALTEAAQIRLTYIAGIRDDLPPSDYMEATEQKLGAALLDAISQASKARSFRDVASHNTDDVAIDLRWELERLRAIGISASNSGGSHASGIWYSRSQSGDFPVSNGIAITPTMPRVLEPSK